MCLLVMQEQNTNIDQDTLKSAYDSNPDGVGYSYTNNNKITTKKFRRYNKFLNSYLKDIREYGSSSPFLLHFRLATHGLNEGTYNVHPFKVKKGMVFAHNGIINEVDYDKKLSDTQVFNRDILKNLKKSFLSDAILLKLIAGFIGSSKLAFLNSDGSFKIINEKLGTWEKGVWFSNKNHEKRSFYPTTYSYKYPEDKISYGELDNDFAYDYLESNKISEKKDFVGIKSSYKEELICGWCGAECKDLYHTNVGDYYSDDRDAYIWMCLDCSEIEDEINTYENNNSKGVA